MTTVLAKKINFFHQQLQQHEQNWKILNEKGCKLLTATCNTHLQFFFKIYSRQWNQLVLKEEPMQPLDTKDLMTLYHQMVILSKFNQKKRVLERMQKVILDYQKWKKEIENRMAQPLHSLYPDAIVWEETLDRSPWVQELLLKADIIHELHHVRDKKRATFYISLWMHEPFL